MKRKTTLSILAALVLLTASAMQAQVTVSTYAGSIRGYQNGSLLEAKFTNLEALFFNGNDLYVSDYNNNAIRIITPDGMVNILALVNRPIQMTLADDMLYVIQGESSHNQNRINRVSMKTGAVTLMYEYGVYNHSKGLCSDADGNLYVSEDHSVYKIITATGERILFAGGGGTTFGFVDGTGSEARFMWPGHMVIDTSGNIYMAEGGNHAVRKITPAGVVTTVAGGTEGNADGIGTAASFNVPHGITIGPDGHLYVSDMASHTIRKITLPEGVVTTIAGIAGTIGNDNGSGSNATFRVPHGLAFDAFGNLYVADQGNYQIRKISFAPTSVSTAASDKEYHLTAQEGEIGISLSCKMHVQVYSLVGASIYDGTLAAGSHQIPAKQGIFMVKVNGTTEKVVVK